MALQWGSRLCVFLLQEQKLIKKGKVKIMSSIDMKACPFCGCHDRRVGIRRMGSKGYKAVCGKCGGTGPYISIKEHGGDKMAAQEEAKETWNRRELNEK